jgi:SAM-dependent methyltransferase
MTSTDEVKLNDFVSTTTDAIRPHNTKAASTWGGPGALYEDISRGISDAIEHCIDRLAPRSGERVLDLACGTGWASRSIATRVPQAAVQGVDIAAGLIEAARAAATGARLAIDYRVGDAEKLPFEDARFDVVISTFGVMFANQPEAAASELARVVKKGGRIGITTWKPDSTVFEMFKVMKPYLPEPPSPPPPSPFAWGNRDRLRELLGASFDLAFEEGASCFRAPSAEGAWEIWTHNYGPTRALAASLPPNRLETFRNDMIAFHQRFATELGISKPREYVLTIAKRK